MRKPGPILFHGMVCFLLLTVATAVVYGHVTLGLWQGRTPGQFDVRHYFVPMSFLYDFALERGEIPEWNPFSFAGTPFAANPQSVVFYPPQFIRSLLTFDVTPLNTFYGLLVLVVLQSVGAGTGTYFLARSCRLGHVASFTAALTFTFGVCLTRRVIAMQFASALIWIPFLLLGLRRMLAAEDKTTRAFYSCGCGLLLGLSVLSGFVHIHSYVAVMIVGYWIADRALGLDRPDGPMTRVLATDAVFIMGLFLVAAGVASVTLLPAAEFGDLTNRAGDIGPDMQEQHRTVSQVFSAMVGPAGDQMAEPEWAMGYRTAGLCVFVLAFAGLVGARKKAALVHVIVFLGLLDCSFGPPFPIATVVEQLNPFEMFARSRAFVVANLPLAIAAGFGVEAMGGMVRAGRWKVFGPALVVCACVVLIWLSRNPIMDITVQLTALLCIAIVAANWISMPRLAGFVACAAVFAECLAWNYRYLPIILDKREFIDIRSYDAHATPDWTSNARTADPAPNSHLYSLHYVFNGYDPLYLRDTWNLLAPPIHRRNYDRILRSTDAVIENPRTHLLFKRNFWLVREIVAGGLPARDTLFAPTTTAFVDDATAIRIPVIGSGVLDVSGAGGNAEHVPLRIDAHAADGMLSQSPSAELVIPESVPSGLHRVLRVSYSATCAGRVRVWMIGERAGSAVPIYETQIREDGPYRGTMIVPLPDTSNASVQLFFEPRGDDCGIDWQNAALLVDHEDENDLITIASRTFNSARVEVGPLDSDRLLVFLDADYPGWSARMDGEAVEIVRVDNAFKGVVVGPGTHTVEFTFRSARMRWGMVVSTVALLLVSGCTVWYLNARRNRGDRRKLR